MTSQEQGNVSILALASMTTLALAMMLALEFACLLTQKLALDNDLNIAREETMAAGFDMQLKNSSDPGMLIAATLAESLARNGFHGEAEVWFYEATDEELAQALSKPESTKGVRALAYYVHLSQERSSVIVPPQWLANLNLQSEASSAICPYALYQTYKPPEVAGKLQRYRFKNGALIDVSEKPLESAPARLLDVVENSIAKAAETALSNQ